MICTFSWQSLKAAPLKNKDLKINIIWALYLVPYLTSNHSKCQQWHKYQDSSRIWGLLQKKRNLDFCHDLETAVPFSDLCLCPSPQTGGAENSNVSGFKTRASEHVLHNVLKRINEFKTKKVSRAAWNPHRTLWHTVLPVWKQCWVRRFLILYKLAAIK